MATVEARRRGSEARAGALQKLAHASDGPWLLGLTAAGLVADGIYCLVDAALRDACA